MKEKAPIGIIGGGITGLSVAYGLQKRGIEAIVYEKQEMPGGVIRSTRTDGWLVEHGPNTLMVRRQEVWDLLADLQLDEKVERAGGQSKNRFIVKDGSPVPIPMSLTGFLKTDLFSVSAKLRLLREPFVSPSQQNDESVAQFITRRLGREPLDYAADPFVSGVYAGNPEQLSLRHTFSLLWELEQKHGSLIKGAIRNRKSGPKAERALISFTGGMSSLPLSLSHYLGENVLCGTEITDLTPTGKGWNIKARSPEGVVERSHSALITTVPAHMLPGLLNPAGGGDHLEQVSQIPYAPLSVVALGYKREQVGHPLNGFGMLIPRVEPYKTLGTLFSSSLFPGRAPEGHVLLTSFAGGARHPELARRPESELTAIVSQELSRLLDIEDSPVFSKHLYWEQAIPQYVTGYDTYQNAIKQLEARHPGLIVAGNFTGGVSVPDCIVNGLETAKRAALFLSG